MPEDVEILPVPDKLGGDAEGCTVASVQEGVSHNNVSEAAGGAAKKGFSLTPSRNGATAQPQGPASLDLETGESATVAEIRKRREESEREVFSI